MTISVRRSKHAGMSRELPTDHSRVAVWDLPLRLFHWSLAVAVIVSIVAVEILDDIDLHLRSGQIVLGLLIFRIVWGVVGSSTAQFHRFIKGPSAVIATLKGQEPTDHGHNPLGALSVVAMLVCLIVQVLTGLASDDEIFTTGPLVQYLSASQVSWANQIHDWNSKILFFLIGLHLAAIAYYGLAKKRNLIWPMVVGSTNGNADKTPDTADLRFSPTWLAILVAIIASVIAWWVFTL